MVKFGKLSFLNMVNSVNSVFIEGIPESLLERHDVVVEAVQRGHVVRHDEFPFDFAESKFCKK